MTAKEILYKVKDQHNIGTAWQLTEHIIIEAMEKYAQEQVKDCDNVISRPYGIVRWYDNEHEDVVCVDRKTAEKYVKKYNELAGYSKCFVDEDIWLPLNEA